MEARAWKLVVSEADEEELGSRPEATIQILEIILFCGLWKQLAQGRFPSAVGDVKDFVRWFVYVQIPGFGTVIRELWNASVSVNLHHVIFPFVFRRELVGRSDEHAKLSMPVVGEVSRNLGVVCSASLFQEHCMRLTDNVE
jgi:hypothetical protein